ncbi:hypothetical protein bmyco0002_53290 [Bacillus pseudomycoides]|nr:hypothetical protein bmyco0002_53290 [Bacillus pseudomycoides]
MTFEQQNGSILEVKPEAKILSIHTIEDAFGIFPDYLICNSIPASKNANGIETSLGVYEFDFEKMAQTYDAISVSREVTNGDDQYNGQFSPFADWGIASTLWFNTNHLELVKELTTEQLKKMRMNTIY